MIALKIVILTGAMVADIGDGSAVKPAESYASPQHQCTREAPAQFGPRAALRPAVRKCVVAAHPDQRCGHYELYWPHWLAQRALPPVRRWITERC